MPQLQAPTIDKRDYLLITFIGIAFGLFALPILKNIEIPGVEINIATAAFLIIFFAIFANIAIFIASLIAKKIPVILQIAKFGAVGAFNTFLDFGVANLLMAVTSIFSGFWFIIFNIISFIAANASSFFWNKYWTFSSKEKKAEGKFLTFFGVTLVGLGMKLAIAYGVVNYVAHPAFFTEGRWANIGLVLGMLIALVSNFLGYKFIVFKK